MARVSGGAAGQGGARGGALPCLEASGGVRIPHMGVGTYELRGDECRGAVLAALRLGFRLIDTAAGYHNEEHVGAAIAASGVPREELFVVVKIAPKAMVSEELVETGIRESVRKLRIAYADCVLIHWPGCGGLKPHEAEGHKAARRRCWKVMQALQREGVIRHLGVSNFAPRHFPDLADNAEEEAQLFDATNPSRPVINQIELHPLCVQEDVRDFCHARDIVLQQYSPLAQCHAELVGNPVLCAIARERFPGYTVHDVLLMWGLSQGFCVLVRSRSEEHLERNWAAAKAFFAEGELSDSQKEQLKNLRASMQVAEDRHFCWHSEHID
ncbi:aldo/keto reductase [Trypanosoma conorhini]|uniref:Aldo/keto reductase n=1 Tax=Trypanosoma conorhini TaxID=83891 RepID=A0A422PET5_9TRYP|nr:aldo/keto reductase [Trypanosoma conorhini]RNF16211.1 aldo/keto reductase [Trypanosoma conorhini]